MGQSIFEPPSVKGWEGHKAWINSTTMLVRLNAAQEAAKLVDDPANFFADLQASQTRPKDNRKHSNNALSFGDLLLDGRVPPPLQNRIETVGGNPTEHARGEVNLLLTSPEYQLA